MKTESRDLSIMLFGEFYIVIKTLTRFKQNRPAANIQEREREGKIFLFYDFEKVLNDLEEIV